MTTFATMARIIIVNPAILSAAGIPREASVTATILAADGTLRTALITIVLMVFTFNLGVGMMAGFVAFPIMKLLSGRWREVGGEMWFPGLRSLCFFLFAPHWCAFQEQMS